MRTEGLALLSGRSSRSPHPIDLSIAFSSRSTVPLRLAATRLRAGREAHPLGPPLKHGSWIRVEAASASVQTLEVGKASMMRRCDLPARDLRLADPLFVYPSTILGRVRPVVVNLEQIRCVITAGEVLLLNSLASYVLHAAAELQHRLLHHAEGDDLPFEFHALELGLEAACSFLDAQDLFGGHLCNQAASSCRVP